MGYREVPFSLASQIPMLVGRHPIPLLGICVQHDGCKLALRRLAFLRFCRQIRCSVRMRSVHAVCNSKYVRVKFWPRLGLFVTKRHKRRSTVSRRI